MTDGNVSKKGNAITLCLSSKDEKILQIFKIKTDNENKLDIREDERHSERTFRLRSKKWKGSLAKYGVVPCKTSSCQIPLLPEETMPHLTRGLIDGDGWIS